jgi:MFS family permease
MLLRHRFIRAVLVANLFSQAGIWIRNYAVLLYVMEKSGGDAFAVSAISVAEYAPMFLFALVGGVLADGWRPKRTVVWCDLLSAVSVVAVITVLQFGTWQAVFLTTLISAVASQFAQPSGMKLFKVHAAEELAQASISALQTIFALFMVMGPVVGTWVYGRLGIEPALALTAAAFLLSALTMATIPPDRPKEAAAGVGPAALWRDMTEGMRYMVSRKILLNLSLIFMLVGLGVGLIAPLGMFVITERLGLPVGDVQWMTAVYGAGELLGGALIFRLTRQLPAGRMLMLGLLVNAAGIIATGLSPVLWLTLAAQFVIALFQPAIFIGNSTLMMQHTEERFIGRVTGIRTPLMTGAMLVMMSLSAVLKEVVSLAVLYGVAGLLFISGAAVMLLSVERRTQEAGRGRAGSSS